MRGEGLFILLYVGIVAGGIQVGLFVLELAGTGAGEVLEPWQTRWR